MHRAEPPNLVASGDSRLPARRFAVQALRKPWLGDCAMDGGQTSPALDRNRHTTLLLYAARAARGFGDGFAVIILPAYLSEIGFSPFQIGLVAAVALLGSAVITLAVGLLAASRDLRGLLLIGALIMAGTGLALPNVGHIALILAVMFVGTMNPSTGDIGMLVPLEQTMLAHGAADHDRTRTFARYSLIGAVAIGIGRLSALTVMFYLYAGLGLVCAALYVRLPPTRSAEQRPEAAALGP